MKVGGDLLNEKTAKVMLHPVFYFFIGWVYYIFMVPYFMMLDLSLVKEANEQISYLAFDFYYYVDAFLILFAFVFGFLFARDGELFGNVNEIDYEPKFVLLFVFLLMLLAVYKIVVSKVVLFSGYSDFDVGLLGFLNSLLIVVSFSLILLWETKYRKLLFFCFLSVLVITLGLGSRNVAVASIFSVCVFYGIYSKKKLGFFFSLSVFLVLLLVLVGVWRLGFSYGLKSFVQHFVADSVFISVSSMCVIESGRGGVLFSPTALTSFITWIPGFFFDSKYNFLRDNGLVDLNPCSPFGGSGLIGDLYKNFSFFYPVYLFSLGVYSKKIYASGLAGGRLSLTILVVSLPFLMFHVFNQYIYAFLKLFFFNSMILPVIICVISSLILKLRKEVPLSAR